MGGSVGRKFVDILILIEDYFFKLEITIVLFPHRISEPSYPTPIRRATAVAKVETKFRHAAANKSLHHPSSRSWPVCLKVDLVVSEQSNIFTTASVQTPGSLFTQPDT